MEGASGTYPVAPSHEDYTPTISERGMSDSAKTSIWWKSINQFHGVFVSQILECGWESQASLEVINRLKNPSPSILAV